MENKVTRLLFAIFGFSMTFVRNNDDKSSPVLNTLNYFITNFGLEFSLLANISFRKRPDVRICGQVFTWSNYLQVSSPSLLSSFSSVQSPGLVISYTTSHLNSFPAETTDDVAVKATFGRSYAVEMQLLSGVFLAKS